MNSGSRNLTSGGKSGGTKSHTWEVNYDLVHIAIIPRYGDHIDSKACSTGLPIRLPIHSACGRDLLNYYLLPDHRAKIEIAYRSVKSHTHTSLKEQVVSPES